MASPPDFIPHLPGWEDRSMYIGKEGNISFFHYDFFSQALSKIERGHDKDLKDVNEMFKAELIVPSKLLSLFTEIEPLLYRYPAISPQKFAESVHSIVCQEQI